jgi:hypothetical protein
MKQVFHRKRRERRERRIIPGKATLCFPLPAFPAITALPAFLPEIYEDFAGVSIGSLVSVSNGIFLQARENPIDRRREESGC